MKRTQGPDALLPWNTKTKWFTPTTLSFTFIHTNEPKCTPLSRVNSELEDSKAHLEKERNDHKRAISALTEDHETTVSTLTEDRQHPQGGPRDDRQLPQTAARRP